MGGLALAAGLLLRFACPWQGQQVGTIPAPPTFQLTDCPFEGAPWVEREGVVCGHVTVPESRGRAAPRTLNLAVVVLPSRSADPDPDPVVYVAGGPGESVIRRTETLRRHRLTRAIRERRDFVLVDPRGVGYSEPGFCPEAARVFATVRLQGLPRDAELAVLAEAARRCREAMIEAGTDLSAYNSVAMARDLDDVRRALGYQEWNLLAFSYGTRVALTALREAPEGIRAAVLDGPVPPNLHWWSAQIASFGRSLELVFERCAADAGCAARFPDLERALDSTMDALRQQPFVVPMPESAGLPEDRLVIDPELLRSGIHTALYRERLIRLLPLVIEQIGARNGAVVRQLAGPLLADQGEPTEVLTHAVLCFEEYPFLRPDLVERAEARYPWLAGWIALDRRRAICEGLQPYIAGAEANSAVRSDVPALLITGELDPVTPPSNGRLAAELLERATLIEVPHRSHGNAGSTECTRGIVLSFLARPEQPPDTACVSEIPPLPFVTDLPR